MTKPQIQARVPPDVRDALDTYADEKDMSRSDALRRLVETSLQEEGYLKPIPDGGHATGHGETVALTVAAIGAFVAAFGGLAGLIAVLGWDLTPYALAGPLFTAGGVAAVIAIAAYAVARITHGRTTRAAPAGD